MRRRERTKDIGKADKVFPTIGASNHSDTVREVNDYYATDPKAVEKLLEVETFSHGVFEPCCGEGHISKALEKHGYSVISRDLIYRGYGVGGMDFMQCSDTYGRDIITNPPYRYAMEFVEHALEVVEGGQKVAMFLKLTFLEGKKRRKLFDEQPPKVVYVSSERMECAKSGIFTGSSAIAYAWFVWEKGWKGDTIIKWI